MSKTTDLQIEKTRTLIAGLRKHLPQVESYGVREEELAQLEQAITLLNTESAALEELRAKVSARVKEVNGHLDALKHEYARLKGVVRNHYPQERWADYGVMDKR